MRLAHVPKTAGTSMALALFHVKQPPPVSREYMHVLPRGEDVISTCDPRAFAEPEPVAVVLRDPFERLQSEYHFLASRLKFRNLYRKQTGETYPATFAEYAASPAGTDSACKFLLGRNFLDPSPVSESETSLLLRIIARPNVAVGMTERIPETLEMFSRMFKLVLPADVPKTRTNHFKIQSTDETLRRAFEKRNACDYALQEAAEKKFDAQTRQFLNFNFAHLNKKSPEEDVRKFVLRYMSNPEHLSLLELCPQDADKHRKLTAQNELFLREIKKRATEQSGPDLFVPNWLELASREVPELARVAKLDLNAKDMILRACDIISSTTKYSI